MKHDFIVAPVDPFSISKSLAKDLHLQRSAYYNSHAYIDSCPYMLITVDRHKGWPVPQRVCVCLINQFGFVSGHIYPPIESVGQFR